MSEPIGSKLMDRRIPKEFKFYHYLHPKDTFRAVSMVDRYEVYDLFGAFVLSYDRAYIKTFLNNKWWIIV